MPKSKEAQAKFMDELRTKIRETYKDGTSKVAGVDYTVKFDISVSIDKEKTADNLKADENIMTVDNDKAKGRAHVGGEDKKINQDVVEDSDDALTNIHEIGHMLGLTDRYSDYQKGGDKKTCYSITHNGYKDDVLGSRTANLNQSHYDQIVKETVFKIGQGQKHLSLEFRQIL